MINSYQTYYKQVPAEYWNELKRKQPIAKDFEELLYSYIFQILHRKKNWMISLLFIKHLPGKKINKNNAGYDKRIYAGRTGMGYEAWTEGHEKINEKYPVQVETIREYPSSK